MDENIEAVEEQEEEQKEPDIASFLSKFPGSPNTDQIEAWKQKFGEILCSAFTEEEIFIWRPLSRQEYLAIQNEAMQARQEGIQVEEAEMELRVVSTCILWSSEPGTKSLDTKGGSISTLNEQIMLNSNFMPPAMAASMVIKL